MNPVATCHNEDIDVRRYSSLNEVPNTHENQKTITGEREVNLSVSELSPTSIYSQIPETDSETHLAGNSWQYYPNCMMATLMALLYLVFAMSPHMLTDFSLANSASSKTNIPKDGPSTVYTYAPPPTPFFESGSAVYDSYNGDMWPAAEAVEDHGYVFVMYYATWSTRCRLARDEFEKAAQNMAGRVPFVAINCWYTKSQCKSKYNFLSFPSFYVYASGMEMGFAFTGIEKSQYFERYIQSLLNPITHIYNTSQLINFVSKQESSLVGYFNLSRSEPYGKFQQFYYASLRSIEKDYIQPVRFGLLSDLTFASRYSMDDERNLLLIRSLEDNLVYPPTSNFTSTAITRWINKYKTKPLVNWLFPHGKKAFRLYKTLKAGSTVVLLTPYNACSSYNKDLLLLREVALDYFSCNATEKIKDKISLMISGSRQSRQSNKSLSNCLDCKRIGDHTQVPCCCYSLATTTNPCQVCLFHNPQSGYCSSCQYNFIQSQPTQSQHFSRCSCMQRDILGSNTEVCCLGDRRRHFTDEFISTHRTCNPVQSRSDLPLPIYTQCNSTLRLDNDSAVCMTNSTPSFLAVDSSMYTELVRRLGIDQMLPSRSRLALLDSVDESYYVMKGDYNKTNIVNFFERFYEQRLVRENEFLPKTIQIRRATNVNNIGVVEINTTQLENLLANQHRTKQDVVVFFYSKWCLHCKAVNHVFLSTYKYLSRLTSIKFYRFDVSANLLRWKYAINRIPTVTLFTHSGEPETLTTTDSMETLLRMILRHCSLTHMVELSTTSPQHRSLLILLVRSKLTGLTIKLNDYENILKLTNNSDLYKILIKGKKHIRQLWFSLTKLYIHMYTSGFADGTILKRRSNKKHSYEERGKTLTV